MELTEDYSWFTNFAELFSANSSKYFLPFFIFYIKKYIPDRRTDGRTESDAYEPTVQYAQVGSKTFRKNSERTVRLLQTDFMFYISPRIHFRAISRKIYTNVYFSPGDD